MSKVLSGVFVLMICVRVAGQTPAITASRWETGSVLRGTINVLAANDKGMVLVTDSRLTWTGVDSNGRRKSLPSPQPGQKLFQIDDRTVCAFAGFASADSPLPGFLDNVSGIMGRYEDALSRAGALSVARKLEILGYFFAHYLTGVANLRDNSSQNDYSFELFIAGYDPDGTAEVGSVILRMVSRIGPVGSVFDVEETEHSVVPVGHQQILAVHGRRLLAEQILRNPSSWETDPAVETYDLMERHGEQLNLQQMKALAMSIEKHTAEHDSMVGGEIQVAVLREGRVEPLEQPDFAPVSLTKFKFRVLFTLTEEGRAGSGQATTPGIVTPGTFSFYFKNLFIRVQQELDDNYYSGNVFRDCVLVYRGGKIQFTTTNQVIDSDLVLVGSDARRDSPEVEQILRNFKWRNVESRAELKYGEAPLMYFGNGLPIQ
jgi:20S proteasome alpha/beta subunit